ncbi:MULTISPECIES: sulfotransferase [Microbulbifer]|nr:MULTISPECIES: sulfotransferase [Microbulbifer]
MKYKKHSQFYHVLSYLRNPWHLIRNYRWAKKSFASNQEFIFVVGAPRSGTTLIQKLIGNASEVSSFEFETEVYSKKNIFDYFRFSEFISKQEYLDLVASSSSRSEFLLRWHERKFNSRVFLEKTPQHVFFLDEIFRSFRSAKIVNVVRDPRDAYLSGLSGKNIPQARSCMSYAKYWRDCISAVNACGNKSRIYTVKYEDLVVNPNDSLKGLFEFLGLHFDDRLISLPREDHRASKREFIKLNKPIDSSSVAKWKMELTSQEVDVFLNICGEGMIQYGYRV